MKKRLSIYILSFYAVLPLSAQRVPSTTNTASTTQPQLVIPKAINPYGITSAEMQELSHAREEALKSNPSLAKDVAELTQKMRDFQHKLDQAILAEDPNVAPVVARIEKPAPPLAPSSVSNAAAQSTPLSGH